MTNGIIIDGTEFTSALTVEAAAKLPHVSHTKKMPSGLTNMGINGIFCGEAVHCSVLFDEKGHLLRLLMWGDYSRFMEHPQLFMVLGHDLSDDHQAACKWFTEISGLEENTLYEWGTARIQAEQWSERAVVSFTFR